MNFFFFFFPFYLSIHHAQQQRRGRPSNVFPRFGRRQCFNNWYRDLAHPSPNFHRGGQKVRNVCRLKHYSTLSGPHLKMQQDIRILKNAMLGWSPYDLAKFGEVGSTHPWESSVSSDPPPKIAREKSAKSSTTQPWIIRFCSNFVESSNAWHSKCCKISR